LKEPGRPAQSIIAGGSYREALSYLYMNRRVYYPLFTFNTAAGMLSLGFGAWIVPVLIRVWHLTIPEIGLTLGLMMLAGPPIGLAVVGYLMDYASQRQGPRGPLFVGIGAIVIIAALTTSGPIMPNLSVFWMILVAIMVVSGACFPITNTVVAAITPAHILGRITGVQYILYGVFAGALSATFIALASDHLFSGPTAIAKALSLMCAIYGMVAFVAAIIAVKNLKVWYAGRLM
jgi:MFS family permease